MSKELMYIVITKMHLRLNDLIEKYNFDLLNEEVQHYSRRLDRILSHYTKVAQRNKSYKFSMSHLDRVAKCVF